MKPSLPAPPNPTDMSRWPAQRVLTWFACAGGVAGYICLGLHMLGMH